MIGTTLAAGAAAAMILAAAAPSPAQTRTLVVAASGTPEGFDGDALRPHTQETVVQDYDPLVTYARTKDAQGRDILDSSRIVPNLAESWAVDADGKRDVFKLRQGVKSARGNELTAADVEWSWARSFAQKRTGNFIANVSSVTAVKALSKYEVEFTLSAPSSIFIKALTLCVPGIYDTTEVKRHATAEDPWALKWLESNTAGFGPYNVESLRSGEQAVFVANPNYFKGAPHFGRVVYRAVPSGANRVTLLKSGQVRCIERPNILQVEDLKKDRRVKVDSTDGRLFAALWMNTKFEPYKDIKVRQALNYAVDRDALLTAVFRGEAVPAKTFIAPSIDGQDQSFFDFKHDPAKAKQLLAEAGHVTGLQIEILYSDIYWWLEAMAIQVADQLKAVNVTATPKRITASDMRAAFAPNRRDLPFFAWEDGPLVLDAGDAAFLLLHSQGAANRFGYVNPEVDALVLQIRQELDTAKRNGLLKELQRKVMADSPWVLTFYPTLFEAMAPNIVGWVSYPDDHERWAELKEQR